MREQQERLLDLLERWRELADQGREIGAEELCADCPELIPELKQQLRLQQGLDLPYLAMEYVEGDTLEKRLGCQLVKPFDAARLLLLLARAVGHAHSKGIINRDLKPGNVLLAPPADEPALNCAWGYPKLMDFGL